MDADGLDAATHFVDLDNEVASREYVNTAEYLEIYWSREGSPLILFHARFAIGSRENLFLHERARASDHPQSLSVLEHNYQSHIWDQIGCEQLELQSSLGMRLCGGAGPEQPYPAH